jgi:hypothetical protein
MKLRIKGDSLRLRLTKPEVDQLQAQAQVEDSIHFGLGTLRYKLSRGRAAPDISAVYADNVIEIRVPDEQALSWCRSEQVTLAHSQALPEGALRIVVEKDFACLAPREDEDESEHFPHPGAQSGQTC